ncbi:MAG: nucleotidyltransferase domain-containing protein [Candidatus Bathyarchaeia archaeon]
MAEKPTRSRDRVAVEYSEKHWSLLVRLRGLALATMKALSLGSLPSIVHGSVARGDVDTRSDVDVVIPLVAPSHRVELALTNAGFKPYSRRIVQATPGLSPKAQLSLDLEGYHTVTFPLLAFKPRELDFYKFGGMLNPEQVAAEARVPGCTKRLTLIEPTPRGHIESPIEGRESEVARVVGVALETVQERVRVLKRRDEVGRTGVYLNVSLAEEETFEGALKRLADSNPVLRRRYARG